MVCGGGGRGSAIPPVLMPIALLTFAAWCHLYPEKGSFGLVTPAGLLPLYKELRS